MNELNKDDLLNYVSNVTKNQDQHKKRNESLDVKNDSVDNEIVVNTKKSELITRLKGKIEKMNDRRIMVEMKYSDYKKWFDRFNITIILISALLTILQAITNDIDIEMQTDGIKHFLKLSPLILSTSIGLISSVVKFRRYQEKLESIARSSEKSIFTTYRMKKLQEDLYFAKASNFEKIQQIYLDEIFNLYNLTQAELEKNLKFQDIIKYTNKKNMLSITGDVNLYKLSEQRDKLIPKNVNKQESKSTQIPDVSTYPKNVSICIDTPQINSKPISNV